MKVPFDRRFSTIVAISQSPCIVGHFSPLMKVLGTWNRVHRVQWMYPLVADFPRSLPISQSPCYSREFFTPYESTRDVKPRTTEYNENTLMVADFPRSLPISQSPCIVGNFSPLMKVLGTWNRARWVQWKYPLVADFPRSWPISQSPFMVGNFSPLMKVLGTWNRVSTWVQWRVPLGCRFYLRSTPISQSPCIVWYFSPLMKVLGTWIRLSEEYNASTLSFADFRPSWPMSTVSQL